MMILTFFGTSDAEAGRLMGSSPKSGWKWDRTGWRINDIDWRVTRSGCSVCDLQMPCLLATVKSVQCGPKGNRRKMGRNDRPLGLPFSRMFSRHKLWVYGEGGHDCPTGCPPSPLPSGSQSGLWGCSKDLEGRQQTLVRPDPLTGDPGAAFFCFDGRAGSCLTPLQVASRAARGSPMAKSEVTSGPPCCALEACPPAAPSH